MPTALGTPQHWRERAREARDMADHMEDPEGKRSMFEVAERYEHIAKRSEAKLAGVTLPPDNEP